MHINCKCKTQIQFTLLKCPFGKNNFCQLILICNLFLVLFMGFIALFGIIHGSHYTISTNFYLYLQYFQQKVFSFSKINKSQTDLKSVLCVVKLVFPFLKSYHDFLLFSGVCGMHLYQNLIFLSLMCVYMFVSQKEKMDSINFTLGVCLGSAYFAKIENFLLKVLQIKVKVS